MEEVGRRIAAKLRAGWRLADWQFDELYPLLVRALSATHWTPLEVALRGALTTQGTFFGVEQRESLVACAREAASRLDAANATFMHGVFEALDPKDYDAFYFYNPFEENMYTKRDRFDWSVPPNRARFRENVRKAREFLGRARRGARVVTYNGMGGEMPHDYDLVSCEGVGCCALALWVKGDGGGLAA